jgi:hypothetical protein
VLTLDEIERMGLARHALPRVICRAPPVQTQCRLDGPEDTDCASDCDHAEQRGQAQ